MGAHITDEASRARRVSRHILIFQYVLPFLIQAICVPIQDLRIFGVPLDPLQVGQVGARRALQECRAIEAGPVDALHNTNILQPAVAWGAGPLPYNRFPRKR